MLFARNLEVVRNEQNLTVAQFAEATGISETTIRRIRTRTKGADSYNPSLSTLIKASKALKVDVSTLISRRVNTL